MADAEIEEMLVDSVVEQSKTDQPAEEKDENRLVLNQEEIDDLLKEDYENIVEDPKDMVDQEKFDPEQLQQMMEQLQKMDPSATREFIQKLGAGRGLNPEELSFDPQTRRSFLKQRLKERINQKQFGRKNRASQTRFLKKMEEKQKELEEQEQEDGVSTKTLKNRRRNQRRKAKKKLARLQALENGELPEGVEEVTDNESEPEGGDKPAKVEASVKEVPEQTSPEPVVSA